MEHEQIHGIFSGIQLPRSCLDKCRQKNVFHDKKPTTLSGSVRAQDVHLLAKEEDDWDGDLAIFTHSSINRFS